MRIVKLGPFIHLPSLCYKIKSLRIDIHPEGKYLRLPNFSLGVFRSLAENDVSIKWGLSKLSLRVFKLVLRSVTSEPWGTRGMGKQKNLKCLFVFARPLRVLSSYAAWRDCWIDQNVFRVKCWGRESFCIFDAFFVDVWKVTIRFCYYLECEMLREDINTF